MSVWLIPSLSSAVVAALVLTGVYGALYRSRRQRPLGLWAIAWGLYALRCALMLLAAERPEEAALLEAVARWTEIGGCLLLLAGANSLFERRPLAAGWIGAGVAAAVWHGVALRQGLPVVWQVGPVALLQAAIVIRAGRLFLTAAGKARTTAQTAAGLGLVAWGVPKADLPALQEIPALVPGGLMLGMALMLLIAVATLLVYVEHVERDLRDDRERYRARFTGTHAVALVIDPQGGAIVDANPAAAFYGYSIEDLCARRITEINVLSREEVTAEMRRAEANRRNHFLFRHRLASGEIRDVEVYSSPIPCEGRTLLFSIIHDITERRRAEESLRKLSRAVEQSPLSVVITDLNGNIEYVNPQFEAATGYAAAEVIGQNARILKSGHMPAPQYERLWQAIGSGDVWRGELHNRRKDGTLFWEAASISGVRDETGAITHYIAIKRDITERKRREAELLAAKQMAEAANLAKSTFLANMSHELRTPLNAIIGFSEVMKGQMFGPIGDPRYQAYAADIHRSGMHLLDVINAILDLAKLEAGKFELHEEVVAVDQVIGDCLGMVRVQAAAGGVDLAADPAIGLPRLRADRKALIEILLNLLSNAVKFTPPGGRVTVAAAIDAEGRFVLSVTDTGIGIAAADLEKVLAPFGQVESRLSRRHAGTGLGLPLTRSLVRQHDGTLDLVSAIDAGTSAIVRFPRDRVVQAAGIGDAA